MAKFVANSLGQFASRTCMNCKQDERDHVDRICPLPAAPAQPASKPIHLDLDEYQ
jgi:hypothetical protein